MKTRESRRRTLLVDDEADFRTIVRGWLESEYEHADARDADEFEHALAVHKPDLIILDLRMEGLDGFELCRRLRADPRWKSVPVLFLTGSREVRDFQKNFEAGGTTYLMKPVSRKQLLAAVSDLLSAHVGGRDMGVGD
jgi:CheY-like chemotaxis protein